MTIPLTELPPHSIAGRVLAHLRAAHEASPMGGYVSEGDFKDLTPQQVRSAITELRKKGLIVYDYREYRLPPTDGTKKEET